eukprot:SAG31_NODE_1711_length_7472_cov_2.107555_7_plen_135_part_00
MKFKCFPKPGDTGLRKATTRPATLDLRAAASRPRGNASARGEGTSNPYADIDCDDEVEEEIARAFADGLKVEHGSAAASPPSSPVSDPATPDGADTLIARTVIILDWDDTILTTTRLTSRYSVFGVNGVPTRRS